MLPPHSVFSRMVREHYIIVRLLYVATQRSDPLASVSCFFNTGLRHSENKSPSLHINNSLTKLMNWDAESDITVVFIKGLLDPFNTSSLRCPFMSLGFSPWEAFVHVWPSPTVRDVCVCAVKQNDFWPSQLWHHYLFVRVLLHKCNWAAAVSQHKVQLLPHWFIQNVFCRLLNAIFFVW